MKANAIAITKFVCSYCGRLIISCDKCHKRFYDGEEIQCPKNKLHYCKNCSEAESATRIVHMRSPRIKKTIKVDQSIKCD